MKKRILSLLLALCMVLTLVPTVAFASESASGTCGENLTWELNDGTLTISGTGAMEDYSWSNSPPWDSYADSITKVVIGNGVTSIGNKAFDSYNSLAAVTIPNSVISIGEYAFRSSSLTSVVIPVGVTSIGDDAFYGCSSLTSVTIGDSVTSIGGWAFCGCSSLTSVTIGDSVTSIGNSAFKNCSNLTSVDIPVGVTSIGDDAFSDCSSLTSVTIPDSVTSIGDWTFYGCDSLASVYISNLAAWCKISFSDSRSNPMYFADNLYLNNELLTSVTIPDSVTSIGDYTFCGCSSLTSVVIPDSVTSIGSLAFYDCSNLTSVTIGDGVISIGRSAFSDCSSLTSVDIPVGVTSIGDDAFSDCSSLTSVTIGDGVISIGSSAFENCSNLTSVTIGDSVTSIDSWAFCGCSSLTSVVIPDSVTSIEYAAFSDCRSLTSMIIPNGVTIINGGTFSGCSSLTSVDIPDSVTSIEYAAFSHCRSLTSITIGNNVTSIGSSAFCGCSKLNTVVIPDSVTDIGSYAFSSCNALTAITVDSANTQFCSENGILFNKGKTEIICYPAGKSGAYTIPGGVTAIGEGAFDLCDDLTSVTFTNSVTSIAYGAFYGCDNLADVTLPASLTSIDSYAFYSYADDPKLKNAYFNGNAPDVGSSIFPADTTLHYTEGTTGWTDSEYYDADAGTWHGYKLAAVGGSGGEGSSSNVSGTVKGVYGSKFTYSDRSFFTGSSSTTYNHELAIASCNLAIAAFNASGAEGENYTEASAAENVRELLARLGFSAAQVETGTYAGKPSTNSIAAAIASKEISDGDETWTLLTVAVRGGGYEAEWGGNFNVGSSGAHEGFDMAAGKVCQAVMDYVETHDVGGKVAVWITGYSRGAAVANRVASALSGGYLGEVGCYVNANDVYAYTFETPMASLNTDSVERKNIFNIVNATDIVAKVAPSAWGFGRYGTDVVFPTAEMSSIFGSSFESYLSDAETYYADFTDGDVLPKNFKAYKLDYQNGVIKMVEDTNSFRRYHSFFVDEFVNDSICGELFTSRSDYADSWEEVVVEAATSLNAAGLNLDGLTTAGLEELADEIAQYILDYLKEQGLIKVFTEEVAKKFMLALDLIDTLNGEKKKEFFEGFSHILVSAGVLTVSEEAAADMLDDAITLKSMKQLLEFLLKNFEEIYTLVKNLAWVEVAHEPQFCLAWLLSTPEMMMKESQKTYRIIGVNCPVDVRVYDSNGVLVAAIINDQVQEIEGSTVSAIIDENGQKIILLPADEEYRVETTATADGTMSYSVTEYDAALGEKTRVINYYDMVLDEGTKYTGTVENLAVESAQYPLQTESGNVVPVSEELRGEEISSYVVTVTAEANGYVSGGGAFTCGEYAKVSAIADEGAEFRGWYSDGELVSEDAEYRFRVSKDIELTAKFDTGVTRIFGADRYETAFKTAEVLKQQLGVEKFDNIVVACGDNFADALGGSYLAAKKNAPILLVKSSKIDAVKSYIKANLNLGGTVYLLGGTAAIPAAMDTGLDGFTVRRLAGATRYDTNLLILEEAGVADEDILICTGKNFADSLSAAAAGRPILLVKDSLNDSQKAFLQSHAANKKYILGGTAAVSTSVENQAKAYGTVERIGGNTRYETSVLIAKEFFPNAKQAALAYAQNFPDGLSGGALAYAMKAPLVLTASGKEAAAAAYAKEQGITSGVIFGGSGLISDKAARTIFQMQSGDAIQIG